MKTEIVGAKILHHDDTWLQDSLVIDGPYIEGVGKTGTRQLDASNYLLLPGIIDIHGDGFERLIMPRPSALIPHETGFFEADRQIIASGITTAYFSMTYTWEKHDALRRESGAHQVMDSYQSIKSKLHCDPKLHLRFEIYHLSGLDTVNDWMKEGYVDLLAFNDHLSYQEGKIKDQRQLKEVAARFQVSEQEVLAKLKEVRALKPKALKGVERLAETARDHSIVMASHDEEEPAVREWYHQLGCRLCEFPCNPETARKALDLGDHVLLGAPNALRGGSLYQRMSVRNCINDNLCTVLTSDYYYPSQLQATFLMAELGLGALESLWALNSKNAADAVGLHDRGEIKEGLRADLLLVEKPVGGLPSVAATFVAGELVYASRSFFEKNRLIAA